MKKLLIMLIFLISSSAICDTIKSQKVGIYLVYRSTCFPQDRATWQSKWIYFDNVGTLNYKDEPILNTLYQVSLDGKVSLWRIDTRTDKILPLTDYCLTKGYLKTATLLQIDYKFLSNGDPISKQANVILNNEKVWEEWEIHNSSK